MEKKSNIATRGMKWGAVSLGALIIAAPNLVMAQDAPEAKNSETVIITGLRGSLAKSLNVKKNSTSIVEVVTAEEIGKLPDSSIAESLSRLAGVAGTRVNGDVQVLNIRGTSPDFTVTTLNGRQQGSLNDTRGVEVDQYPSELMAAAVVYKTPDAAITGMGLSGTVDLRTLRPLSVNGRKIVVNLRADTSTQDQLNPDVSKNGWRGSASYVNQFMDGKLGVAIGYAHMDTTNQVQHQKLWGWIKGSEMPSWEGSSGNFLTGGTASQLSSNILTGFELRANSVNKKRDGGIATFEYKPNDNMHTTLDIYYSQMKQKEIIRDIETNVFWTNDSQAGLPLASAVFGNFYGNPTVVGGTFVGMAPIQNNQLNTRDDKVYSIGLNHEAKAGIWDLVADLSYSKTEGDQLQSEVFAGYGLGGARAFDSFKFNIPTTGFITITPGLNYGDASKMNLGDNAPWGGWGADGHVRYPHVEDSYATYSFSGKTALENSFVGKVFKDVHVGISGWQHEKAKSVTEADLFLKSRTAFSTNSNARPIAPIAPYANGTTNLNWAGFGGIAAFDILAAINGAYKLRPIEDTNHYNKDWTISEDVYNVFVKLDIDNEIAAHRVRGNLGVQYVATDTRSTGDAVITNNNNGNLTPTHVQAENKYSDVLPSLNLAIDLTKNQKLRLGIAKQMARPRTDDLRANFQAGLSALSAAEIIAYHLPPPATTNPEDQYYVPSGSGGNPYLLPWRAKAFDLSYEFYISRKSLVAVAGYYKKMDTYVYSQTIPFDFTGMPNPLNRKIYSTLGPLTTPQNGKGGYIKGIEIQTQLDLGEFLPVLEGFGFAGNYTKNWTDIRSNAGGTAPLPGFSGITYNAAAYYEKNGFQARVSYSYRDPTYSDVAGLFATTAQTSILENAHVDAQIGYEFQEGPMKGLAITLQGYNITDEPYSTTAANLLTGTSFMPEVYETYGKKYLLGVRYQF